MAVSKKPRKRYRGKVGQSVEYPLNGQWVKRSVGKNNTPATMSQLACRAVLRITNEMLSPVKDLVVIGFEKNKRNRKQSPYNLACGFNMLNAIAGEYPDLYPNFAKARFTQGRIPVDYSASNEIVDFGILFTWNTEEDSQYIKWNDQVILIIYMPETKEAIYHVGTDIRKTGSALIKLPRYDHKVIMETYISFISANHKYVSNSLHLGRIIW
jgi:hypothetical protein